MSKQPRFNHIMSRCANAPGIRGGAQMSAREKAYWLVKATPYKQEYMAASFREGARAFWRSTIPEWRGNSRERSAFTRGYEAAKAKDAADAAASPSTNDTRSES